MTIEGNRKKLTAHGARRRARLGVALVLGLMSAPWLSAPAQYPYPYPQPVYPSFGPGGYLHGEAAVINASGDLFVKQEQARIEREKANQAKLDTRKKTFDLSLYEKMLTPTYGEQKSRTEALILKRVMASPTQSEITSGRAQNLMLPLLSNLALDGIPGPPVKLDPEQLKEINATVGTDGPSIGILKDGGVVDWPLVVRGPSQKKLADLLPKAVEAAAYGTLNLKQYNECSKGVAKLQDELRKLFHTEEIDGGMFLEGKRFLDSLDSGVKALRTPAAAKMLKGAYALTARTVSELVTDMSNKGLKFAPANLGRESAYHAVFHAMVAYSHGAMNSDSFKSQFAAINLNQQYYEKSKKATRP